MQRRELMRAAAAAIAATVIPGRLQGRGRQAVVHNVRDYGAAGNGLRDDTGALQAAIDALPSRGGIVRVPAGSYRIDPARGVRLRSDLRLELEPDALLLGTPVSGGNPALLVGQRVRQVQVTGGRLAALEAGAGVRRGAAGFGVLLRAAEDLRIEGLTAEGFWMDGLYVGAASGARGWVESRRIVFERCHAIRNRRQGVSVTSCEDFSMVACECRQIGRARPGAGVDLEPNPERRVVGVVIRGCRFERCAGPGVMTAKSGVSNVDIVDNRFVDCGRGGIWVQRARQVRVTGNVMERTTPAVIVRRGSTEVRVERNDCGGATLQVDPDSQAVLVDNRC